jgi:hypothetical protein
MTRLAAAVLATITLAGATLAHASGKPVDTHAVPSSFAPRPHTGQHVYGSPIDPPIVGHAQASHYAHAATKHHTSAKKPKVHTAPVLHHKANDPLLALGPQPTPR